MWRGIRHIVLLDSWRFLARTGTAPRPCDQIVWRPAGTQRCELLHSTCTPLCASTRCNTRLFLPSRLHILRIQEFASFGFFPPPCTGVATVEIQWRYSYGIWNFTAGCSSLPRTNYLEIPSIYNETPTRDS